MPSITVSTTNGAIREIVRACSVRSFVQPAVYQAVRAASTKTCHVSDIVFARPTVDVAFKQMLSLEAFTGKKISKVLSVSEALPSLKRDSDENENG